MQINLTKSVFTPRETDHIIDKLKQASEKGFVTSRSENNPYLLASFRGVEEKGITPKWNVKICSAAKVTWEKIDKKRISWQDVAQDPS
jgi:hypothetical protein